MLHLDLLRITVDCFASTIIRGSFYTLMSVWTCTFRQLRYCFFGYFVNGVCDFNFPLFQEVLGSVHPLDL